MTNTQLLRSLINEKGIKLNTICRHLGISYPALRNKIDNKSQFKASQIEKLCELLGVNSLEDMEALFFCKEC